MPRWILVLDSERISQFAAYASLIHFLAFPAYSHATTLILMAELAISCSMKVYLSDFLWLSFHYDLVVAGPWILVVNIVMRSPHFAAAIHTRASLLWVRTCSFHLSCCHGNIVAIEVIEKSTSKSAAS